jgi:hypothetical protein
MKQLSPGRGPISFASHEIRSDQRRTGCSQRERERCVPLLMSRFSSFLELADAEKSCGQVVKLNTRRALLPPVTTAILFFS